MDVKYTVTVNKTHQLVKGCEYDIALSLDDGGSSFMNNKTKMVFY